MARVESESTKDRVLSSPNPRKLKLKKLCLNLLLFCIAVVPTELLHAKVVYICIDGKRKPLCVFQQIINYFKIDKLFRMNRVSINYPHNSKHSIKYYFLTYLSVDLFYSNEKYFEFFSCFSTPLRVHYRTNVEYLTVVQFLAMPMLTYLK